MKQKPIKPPHIGGGGSYGRKEGNQGKGPGNRREAGQFHDHDQKDRGRGPGGPGGLRAVFLRECGRAAGWP